MNREAATGLSFNHSEISRSIPANSLRFERRGRYKSWSLCFGERCGKIWWQSEMVERRRIQPPMVVHFGPLACIIRYELNDIWFIGGYRFLRLFSCKLFWSIIFRLFFVRVTIFTLMCDRWMTTKFDWDVKILIWSLLCNWIVEIRSFD